MEIDLSSPRTFSSSAYSQSGKKQDKSMSFITDDAFQCMNLKNICTKSKNIEQARKISNRFFVRLKSSEMW